MKTPCRLVFLVYVATLCVGGLLSPRAEGQTLSCQSPNYIEWPAANPVWKFCWVAPPNSSGVDGSGIELREVYYRNKLVLARAHIPVLNVKYDAGGCGGTDLSYRDWLDSYKAFEANNVLSSGYAEPTVPPRTVCDHPGYDAGSFSGVAVEKLADRLTLTTQLQAGWYRYIHQWNFYLDGRIEPRMYFTAVDNYCTPKPHHHNAYWRFDFDLAGAGNDLIEEQNSGTSSPLALGETTDLKATGRTWRVRDTGTGDTVELIPGTNDGLADAFAVADAWALAWHSTELDDGGATSGTDGDKEHISNYLNGEPIADGTRDTVLWYRSGTYHNGDSAACDATGPTLKVTVSGTSPPPSAPPAAPSNLTATKVASRQIKLTWTDNSNNEDGFKIERSSGSGGAFTQIATVGTNATSYTNTGLKRSRTYCYRTRAYNGSGNSAYSNPYCAGT